MPRDLYLIRHGEPLRQSGVPYNTLPGPDLAPRGRIEAVQAAHFLAAHQLDWLFVSPFARTAQTAEVLVEVLQVPSTIAPILQEHGPHEQFAAVRTRLRELLMALDTSPHQRIGLVSHGSPIRAILLELTNDQIDLSQHVYPGGNPAPPCGIWHVQREAQAGPRCRLAFTPDVALPSEV